MPDTLLEVEASETPDLAAPHSRVAKTVLGRTQLSGSGNRVVQPSQNMPALAVPAITQQQLLTFGIYAMIVVGGLYASIETLRWCWRQL